MHASIVVPVYPCAFMIQEHTMETACYGLMVHWREAKNDHHLHIPVTSTLLQRSKIDLNFVALSVCFVS